ncbi:hypothetical protein A2U01_0004954, partial [Trifolium medium]|nr:hypothetical protein [Trifolium medium]
RSVAAATTTPFSDPSQPPPPPSQIRRSHHTPLSPPSQICRNHHHQEEHAPYQQTAWRNGRRDQNTIPPRQRQNTAGRKNTTTDRMNTTTNRQPQTVGRNGGRSSADDQAIFAPLKIELSSNGSCNLPMVGDPSHSPTLKGALQNMWYNGIQM